MKNDKVWETRLLRDCAQWISGGTPSKNNLEYWNGDIPWISAKSMKDFRISTSDDKVTELGSQNGTRRVPPGTILLVVRGMSLKSEFRIGITTQTVTLNQDLKALIPYQDIDSLYLAYFLKGRTVEILELVGESGHGTGVLPTDRLQNIEIPLPPLAEQRRIADILGSLDDKIALNRRQNETLEAMARALFTAWFVDFEPVRAKAEGRWRQGESLPGMPAELWELFPDSFVDSALGEIPAGWAVGTFESAVDFLEGPGIRNWQYTNSDEGTKFINIRCIHDGDLLLDSANRITDEEANGKYKHFNLEPLDIVVSTSGTLGRSAVVREEHLPLVLNTSVIRFRPIERISTFSFVYGYLTGSAFVELLETMASGSVQRNFGPTHLRQISLILPHHAVMLEYDKICRPLLALKLKNMGEASLLQNLQKQALNKLMHFG